MLDDCLFLAIGDGERYDNMANNLFKSLKFYNNNVKTLYIGFKEIKNCDIFLDINSLYDETQTNNHNLNDFNIGVDFFVGSNPHIGYSFKIGLISKIPNYILKDFKKIIYIDSDSECVQEILFDESIRNSKVYAAWDQSIVTKNINIANNINKKWKWNNRSFYYWQRFAEFHKIEEWKNVNGGLYVIDTNYIQKLFNNFVKWNINIANFFNDILRHNDELVMSLILATEENYSTPDISRNGICQINMNENFEEIRKYKNFKYQPWFFSNEESYPITVKATCVHSPNSKNLFSLP
jgi:hypothetical protein